MEEVVKAVAWLACATVFGLVVLTSFIPEGPTGFVVGPTEDTGDLAPPYDAFSGRQVITLTQDQVDATSFHINTKASSTNSLIYTNAYWWGGSSWTRIPFGGSTWLKNTASLDFQGRYAEVTRREGDDVYVAVWTCKALVTEWKCGCKTADDCGHWLVQGVDLDSPNVCVDDDGDGYGTSAEQLCLNIGVDCDDLDDESNPGMVELSYNGKDDDCDPLTEDDDLDIDGFLLLTDCDDTDASRNPGATETCENTIDEDCDAQDELCGQCGEGDILPTGCLCSDRAYYGGFCCDNKYQVDPCGTPEVIFYDGFESGTGNTWDYLNPNSRVNGDVVYRGFYGLDLIYSPGGTLKTNQYARTTLTPESTVFHRFFIYVEEDFLQTVEGTRIATLSGDDWDVAIVAKKWQGDPTQGKLFVSLDGAEQTTAGIVRNGQWHCVETAVSIGAPNSVTLWVDDMEVYAGSGILVGDANVDELTQGGTYGTSVPTSMHIYVDTVVVSRERIGCS